MHNIAEIRTQITMKSIRKTMHELSAQIPQKAPKRNISSLTNEMMHMDITVNMVNLIISYRKKHLRPPNKKKKRGKNLSPRNRKACHSVNTAFLKSVAEIGTQSAMKSSRKTLHEFTSHIPRKTPKRNRSSATDEPRCLIGSLIFTAANFASYPYHTSQNYIVYPRERFVKDARLLTIWPKDHHRLGLGGRLPLIMSWVGGLREPDGRAQSRESQCSGVAPA
jgi:hypothetical protein